MTTRASNDPDVDEHLIARVAQGDAQAFARLFSRRQAEVYRFALHMTGAPAVADDVTQDVFMVVMRTRDAIRARSIWGGGLAVRDRPQLRAAAARARAAVPAAR